jgi:hypothetical protein
MFKTILTSCAIDSFDHSDFENWDLFRISIFDIRYSNLIGTTLNLFKDMTFAGDLSDGSLDIGGEVWDKRYIR